MEHPPIYNERHAAVDAFACETFGLKGTLGLHRYAVGADLLRAPANVVLAPVFLIIRLAALLVRAMRFQRFSVWLMQRDILLETRVSKLVTARVAAFITTLDRGGLGVAAPDAEIIRQVKGYASARNAIAEITTTIIILTAGYAVFQSATPGILSLAGPVAEMRAHAQAIEQFPLGQGLGRMYYGVFASDLSIWQLVATGFVLAVTASILTAFAGIVADPIQVLTGTHQRRLLRLLDRLDHDVRPGSGIAREQIAARLADISDIALNLWKSFRG